jgi:hypothetical protein
MALYLERLFSSLLATLSISASINCDLTEIVKTKRIHLIDDKLKLDRFPNLFSQVHFLQKSLASIEGPATPTPQGAP